MRYAMVIDTGRCVGCDACAVACKQTHGTGPGVFWSHVEREEVGEYPDAWTEHLPVICNHCEDAPCVRVCPVRATFMDDSGVVVVDHDLCMGCRYCVQACPYDARGFRTQEGYWPEREHQTPFERAANGYHTLGTVEKCIFCNDRVAAGKEPACVQACVAKARFFGDLDDPESEVSKLIAENETWRLQEGLGTQPKVYYIKTQAKAQDGEGGRS